MAPTTTSEVLQHFNILASLQNFANARDVQTLGKTIFGTIIKHVGPKRSGGMIVSCQLLLTELRNMISERARREHDATAPGASASSSKQDLFAPARPNNKQRPTAQNKFHMQTRSATKQHTHAVEEETSKTEDDLQQTPSGEEESNTCCGENRSERTPPTTEVLLVQRDSGVTDAIWEQLQTDRMKAEQEEAEFQRLVEEERKLRAWLKACADGKRQRELEELERVRKEAEERKRKEALVQAKLLKMGCCPVGYHWIKQGGGYRCAGGSHWMDEASVGAL